MSEAIKKMIRSEFDKEIEIPDISLENINKALKELHGTTNEMLNPFDSVFDKMVKDIRDRQDNVIAIEFTKCIGELLKKNGVTPKMTEYTRNFETDNTFETRYGVSIDELDFAEHDKVFEDKIAKLEKENNALNSYLVQRKQVSKDMIMELKQRIAELESENLRLTESILRKETKIHELESKKTSQLPFDPLECANYLINATYERETNGIERAFHNLPEKVDSDRYTVDDLEQIAEHLLVYCKHNKESE
jgi:hypothetical protein